MGMKAKSSMPHMLTLLTHYLCVRSCPIYHTFRNSWVKGSKEHNLQSHVSLPLTEMARHTQTDQSRASRPLRGQITKTDRVVKPDSVPQPDPVPQDSVPRQSYENPMRVCVTFVVMNTGVHEIGTGEPFYNLFEGGRQPTSISVKGTSRLPLQEFIDAARCAGVRWLHPRYSPECRVTQYGIPADTTKSWLENEHTSSRLGLKGREAMSGFYWVCIHEAPITLARRELREWKNNVAHYEADVMRLDPETPEAIEAYDALTKSEGKVADLLNHIKTLK
jgi:hypothetical protein